jgi:hypothetical protein
LTQTSLSTLYSKGSIKLIKNLPPVLKVFNGHLALALKSSFSFTVSNEIDWARFGRQNAPFKNYLFLT